MEMMNLTESFDNCLKPAILDIDPVFMEETVGEPTAISIQFQQMGSPLLKRYSAKLMENDTLATLYKTISGNIINIGSIVKNDRNKIEVIVKSDSKKKKEPTKAELIIASNEKAKMDKELQGFINYMKSHQKELLECDTPTISSLRGILDTYTSTISNKIMKLIILRSLILKYKSSGNELFVSFMFEFMMELNYLKDEWTIPEVKEEVKEVIAEAPAKKKSARALRQQAVKQETIVSDFEYPTVEELSSKTFSDKIKLAIKCAVQDANNILVSKKIDPIKYQMVETYYRLRPVSSWDKKVLSLDEWQKQIVKHIDEKQSVVITAPTSCGKTVCAQYCAFSEKVKKVLFVVPNSVLANQVAGSFCNSGFNTALVTNEEEYNLTDDCKIIVATPCRAEELLCSLSLKLDYAVFDEIQQINELEGEAIERLIKTVNCPFLILSATINEPEKFVEFLKIVTEKDVKLVSYNKRFIVQQKHLWNGTNLITMHPLNCVDTKYIIEDQFKSGDLAMTARDLYEMGIKMDESFPDYKVWKLHPNEYFEKDIPITMDMVSEYEKHLKDALIRLTTLNEASVSKFLEEISLKNNSIWDVEETELIASLVKLFKSLKTKQMLPALVFMLNDVAVLTTYKKVVNYLEYIEQYYFPWFNKLWIDLSEDIKSFKDNEAKLIGSIARGIKGKGNPTKQITAQVNQEKSEFIKSFLQKILQKYTNEKSKAKNNENFSEEEITMICGFLDQDYKYKYQTYLTNQLNSQEIVLPEFNQYCPTSLFSFHKNPLSVSTMRMIVKNLKKFLSNSVDKSIANEMNYENIFVRGIERGIILYSKILPTPFQRVVQELITNHQAPICICDDSLAYGVNYPARSVVILGQDPKGEDVSVLKAQQIQGRSGRRGFDVQGHVIYCRVNYKNIMRGTYAPLIGKDIITPYTLLPTKIFGIDGSQYIKNITKVPLNMYVQGQVEEWNQQELLDGLKELYIESDIYKQEGLMTLLLWLFRDDVLIVPNLFVLVNVLLSYKNSVSIDVIKKNVDKFSHKSGLIKTEEEDDENSITIDGVKTITKYRMQDNIKFQIIEILFRVFDNCEMDENPENITNTYISKDAEFQKMMNETKWNEPLNSKSIDIINCVIKNKIDNGKEDFGYIAKVINKVHAVILNVLKMYNMFADIGNQTMVSILDQPLTYLINFNNKLKSLN